MTTSEFEYSHTVPAPLAETFAFFSVPANLERLTPPLMRFRLLEAPPEPGAGARFRYRMAPLGVPVEWVAELTHWDPPHGFSDVQLRGPYAAWRHTHRFVERADGTEIRDRVEYRLRGGPAGRAADIAGHRAFLRWLFAYRSRRLDELLSPPAR